MVVGFGGAALRSAIGVLFDTVKEIAKKNVMFKPYLESLTVTLEILKPLMDEVKDLNELLTQRQQESAYYESLINEGEKHVRKCSKVCRCNIFKKFYYSNKLLELDRTLKSLIVAGLSARDSKETLILARKIFDFQIASSRSSASVSNETLILVRTIFAKIQGEQGINTVGPAEQFMSTLSTQTPPPPKPEPEPELEPLLPIAENLGHLLASASSTAPAGFCSIPPPSSAISAERYELSYDTESHDYRIQGNFQNSLQYVTLKIRGVNSILFSMLERMYNSFSEIALTQFIVVSFPGFLKIKALQAGVTTFGLAFRSLFDAVKKFVGESTVTMKPVLRKVRATLEVLVPLISQIVKFHMALDLPNGQTITDLKLEMVKAAKLIRKCSNVSRFNLLKKKHYTDMLLGLDESLSRWVQILQIQLAWDVKKSLVLVREIHANIVEHGGINDVGLNQILSRVSSINVRMLKLMRTDGWNAWVMNYDLDFPMFISFFREVGLDEKETGILLDNNPSLSLVSLDSIRNPMLSLQSDLEGKIKASQLKRLLSSTEPRFLVGFGQKLIPRVGFLTELAGGDERAAGNVLRKLPAILSYSVEHMEGHVEFLRSFAGLNDEEIIKIVVVFPNVINAGRERKLHPRIEFLKQCGLNSNEIFKFLTKATLFLGLSFEDNLAYKHAFLVKIGYRYRTKDLEVAMGSITRTSCEILQKVIGLFLSYGLSCENVISMSRKHSQILQYNHSSLEKKIV
ncbi:hypothetical protein FEM48_Zijuj10G0091800 [Ziziphus jujuba var. spinosa]|uniref:RPW8 domain-containing protein n=1 Tax=Ziziphus jujuba var. spinosa TaxID=714518 RepID=A0A978UMI3_ZIZJJ|nr:hypothetical protein FEM48_Zijuj10G0091800 [Ziziphus jujuba var. spinosa]